MKGFKKTPEIKINQSAMRNCKRIGWEKISHTEIPEVLVVFCVSCKYEDSIS